MKTYAFRLKRGQDLRKEIEIFATNNNIKAGTIVSCVGNVIKATLRMSSAKTIKVYEDSGTYEIVSLVGTIEPGNSHMHLCISDDNGNTYGGHLKTDTIVGVTAEIVIGELEGLEFSRELDPGTGYEELVIKGH